MTDQRALPLEPGHLAAVVQTKLRPPQQRADLISRRRLLDAVGTSAGALPLTLVSAPAGYGKTTLLAGLPATRPDLRVAWLALDEDDNDPARFLAGLVAAIRTASPPSGLATQELLATLPAPGTEMRRVIGVLINELVATLPGPCALVLDDLHAVTEPAVYLALDYLIERLPAEFHLVIATRHDPPLSLARLRARRALAEFRLADLRLTADETARFLGTLLGEDPDEAQAQALHARTDGWAAGLSLLASTLGQLPPGTDRDAFFARLATSNRYVFDYLADEVLRRQDRPTRDFLLATAILEELTPAGCAAVTGETDAATTLDDLYRRNLFVLALDSSHSTFRYHGLFRDFLRERLARERPPAEVRSLHRRAAAAEPSRERAIGHLLSAEAWDEAAGAIVAAGDEALARGEIETLRGWIGALPAEVRLAEPRVSYLLGVAAWECWDIANASVLLGEALDRFTAAGDAAGAGEAEVYLASCLVALADYAGAQALLDRARATPLRPHIAAQRDLNRAWQGLFTGDWRGALAALDEALALADTTDDPRVLRIVLKQFQVEFAVLPGGSLRAARLIRLAETKLGDRPSPLAAYVAAVAAGRHLWRGERDRAVAAAERALAINTRFAGPERPILDAIGVSVAPLLATGHALAGNHAAADHHLDHLIGGPLADFLRLPFARQWQATYLYPLARVRLIQGRLDEARSLAAELAIADPREWAGAPALRALLRGKLALAEGRPAEAIPALREAVAAQERFPFTALFGLAALPLAYAHLQAGQEGEALATFTPLLAAHERDGTPGALLWEEPRILAPLLRLARARGLHDRFVAGLLAGLGETPTAEPVAAPAAPPAARPAGLTHREIEILRLIAAGESNAAIASQLFISTHTVKRHVANLLAKLEAETRTQAAARARALGIA